MIMPVASTIKELNFIYMLNMAFRKQIYPRFMFQEEGYLPQLQEIIFKHLRKAIYD